MELLKKILLYSIAFFLITSCAARKVNKSLEEKSIVIDSTSISIKEVVSTQDNNIVITEDSEEIEIAPIDSSKDIVVDGKRYSNAVLRVKRTKKLSIDNTKIKVSEKCLEEVVLSKTTAVKVKGKLVDKKASYSSLIWLLLIVLILALALWMYKKSN
jgi:uncharacterized protein YcfL